jgi:hypothetical protein
VRPQLGGEASPAALLLFAGDEAFAPLRARSLYYQCNREIKKVTGNSEILCNRTEAQPRWHKRSLHKKRVCSASVSAFCATIAHPAMTDLPKSRKR